MVTFFTFIYTIIARLLLIIIISIIALPLLLCLLLRARYIVDNICFRMLARFFYWACIKFSFLPITYKGFENIPASPCIIIANHQSSFDIPLVGYALKKRIHIWLAWEALAKSPLLKFLLTRNALLVDNSSPMKGMRTLLQTINTLKEKPWDVVIFPEGGRYTDGKLRDFFGGFILLATKLDRPIVPIKITGVQKVYPPHTFWIYYYPITVTIGAPLIRNANETDDMFKERAYNWFTKAD